MHPSLRAPLLRNTGSVARDHLASERTFLAWLRTGLGFVALGIAVERFSQLDIEALLPPTTSSPAPAIESIPASAGLQKQKREQSKKGRDLQTQGLVVGLMATGSGSIVYGAARYFSNMKHLERGFYRPSFGGVGGLSAAVLGLTGVVGWGLVRDYERKEEEKRG